MKGWVALHREKLAALEKSRLERVEKQRRQHVQDYLRGFVGFCSACGIVLRGDHHKTCERAVRPDGTRRRLLIIDWERTTVIVTANDGKKYETSNTGWTRRTVRGTDMFTKTVGAGAIAILHKLEAMQAGVVMEKPTTDATSALPSAYLTKPVQQPTVVKPTPIPKAKVFDLSEWDVGKQVSKEAARMSALADRQESLRKKHVAKYTTKAVNSK